MEQLRNIHEVLLTKEQLVGMVFDNKSITVVNAKNEPIIFQGPGTCDFGLDSILNRELKIIYLTFTYKNVTYRGDMILSSDDGKEYIGILFYELKDVLVKG